MFWFWATVVMGWCGFFALVVFVRADRRREKLELVVDQVADFLQLAAEANESTPGETLFKRVTRANLEEAARLLAGVKQ